MGPIDEISTTFNASDSTFRTLFEHSADAMLLLDGGIFVDCNPAAARLMKCAREEILNCSPERLSPERQPGGRLSAEKAAELIQTAFAQGSCFFEWMHRRPNGEEFSVEVSLTAVPYEDRRVLFAVYRDISGRKKIEASLSESEERYRSLFDSLQDGVFVIQDGVFQLINSTMESLTGFRNDELLGKSFITVIAPEDRASVAENYRRRQAGEALPEEYIIHILQKDGKTSVPANLRVMIVNYRGQVATMGTVRNLSEKMRMEEDLRNRVSRRGTQVRLSTEIAQEIAAAPAVDDLITRVVTLIKDRLGYYHTQLLRYEPGLNAVVLVRGYGEVGEKMLAAGHHMEMGRGLIGAAAASGETVLRADITNDPDWRPNPLLPETKGEIAVPVKFGERILGVLDVQSDQANALTEDDRLLLEGLCGQIAISLESARLRQEMQDRLNELNKLYEGAAREGWETFRKTGSLKAGYLYDRVDTHPADELWVDEIEKAVAQKGLTPAESANSAAVAPLSVRGEVIGALGIYDDPYHPLTSDDLLLVDQVSDQVALALESARLFEQTRVALNEAEKLYNFSRKLTNAADLDAVVGAVVESAGIPEVNRGVLVTLEYNSAGELEGGMVRAGWYSGSGHPIEPPVGTRYDSRFVESVLKRYQVAQPIYFDETLPEAHSRGIFSLAVLPLFVGSSQMGVILLQTGSPHKFTDDEKRPMNSLAQQAAMTIQSRLLFEQVTASEMRFRDISTSSADWVWEVDAQGRYTFCSERVKEVLGYSVAEMLGKTPFDFMVPEDVARVGEVFGRIAMNKEPIVDLENRNLTKDGKELIFLTSGVPVLNEQGNLTGYRGVDRDVTEQKALESAILKDRAQLAEAMEAARMASWEFDVAAGTFIFNDAYYRFLETTVEEEGGYLMPAPVFAQKYVHPDDATGVGLQIQQALETTNPDYRTEFESKLRRPDGTYRSALVSLRVEKDAEGRTVRMFGTNQDISERKQAQEMIAKRAVELASVAEITTKVSTIQSPDEMLQTVVDLTKQVFSLYHVHIYLLNDAGDRLVVSKGAGEIGRKIVMDGRQIALASERSLTARAARSRQGVIVNDVRQDPDFLAHPLLPDTRSEMAVPMIAGDRLLGVLDIQDAAVGRFSPEDVNIMTTLAAQVAVSLQNARSYARAQRQAEREALINSISERIQATNSVENALQVAVREIGRALGAPHTAIRLGLERKADGEQQ